MTQRVLISGASSGIGLAIARQMLQQGRAVQGIARDFSNTQCEGLEQTVCDLSELDLLPEQLAKIKEVPNVLILNAGYGRFGGLEQFSYQQIRHLIDTNLISNLFLLKHFLPLMKKNGGGDIVLIGSESALQGGKAGTVYCASKFALRGLAQSLRKDNPSMRVILVNPGPVNSDFFDDLDFAPQAGSDYILESETIAQAISQALLLPSNTVTEELNIQPLKRSFKKK